MAEATGAVEWLALEGLVERVYRIHSRRALERSGWRYPRCISDTGATGRMAGPTKWRTWKRCAGMARSQSAARCGSRGARHGPGAEPGTGTGRARTPVRVG